MYTTRAMSEELDIPTDPTQENAIPSPDEEENLQEVLTLLQEKCQLLVDEAAFGFVLLCLLFGLTALHGVLVVNGVNRVLDELAEHITTETIALNAALLVAAVPIIYLSKTIFDQWRQDMLQIADREELPARVSKIIKTALRGDKEVTADSTDNSSIGGDV